MLTVVSCIASQNSKGKSFEFSSHAFHNVFFVNYRNNCQALNFGIYFVNQSNNIFK